MSIQVDFFGADDFSFWAEYGTAIAAPLLVRYKELIGRRIGLCGVNDWRIK